MLKREQKEKQELQEAGRDHEKKSRGEKSAGPEVDRLREAEAEVVKWKKRNQELEDKLKDCEAEGDKKDREVQKYKQRISEMEKEKGRVVDDFNQKIRNEDQVIVINNNRIEDLTKSNHQLNRKVPQPRSRRYLRATRPTNYSRRSWLSSMPSFRRRRVCSKLRDSDVIHSEARRNSSKKR